MRNKKFFCFGCDRVFDTPEYYDESHGLDSPPYERVATCPECMSDDFITFDTVTYKDDVVEKVIPAIAALNRLSDNLNDVFGNKMNNDDLSEGLGLLTELVCEMFYFNVMKRDTCMEEAYIRIEKDVSITGPTQMYVKTFKGE